MLFFGVALLGVLIIVGPAADGESRCWALVAFFALGLFLTVFGGAAALGVLLVAFEGARRRRARFRLDIGSFSAAGEACWGWSRIVSLDGRGVRRGVPLDSQVAGRELLHDGAAPEAGGVAVEGAAAELDWAESFALLWAAGVAEVTTWIAYEWSLREGELQRERTVQARLGFETEDLDSDDEVLLVPNREENPVQDPSVVAIRAFLLSSLRGDWTLAAVRKRFDVDELRRKQLEDHLQRLRDAGVAPNPAVTESIAALLERTQEPVM